MKQRQGARQQQAQAQQAQAQQAEQQTQATTATFDKAFAACMEGRGYTVK